MSSIRFKLYVAGQTSRSARAVANLRRIADEALRGRYELVIIDVLDDPDSAEADRILTTPTLIKEAPTPPRRVTGDLSDREKVLLGLGLEFDIQADPDAEELT